MVERSRKKEYFGFPSLEAALDFVEQRETDLGLNCALYQNVPLVEED